MRTLGAILLCVWGVTGLWGVAGRIMVSTYAPHEGQFSGDNDVPVMAGSPVACTGRCLLHPDCGAYVFRPKQVPNCHLMTIKIYSGGTYEPAMYFSGVSLTTGHFLFRVPVAVPDFQSYVEQCEAGGAQLVLFPAVLKDLIATGSHGKFYYDLRRDSEDTETYTTYDGAPVDTFLVVLMTESSKEDVAPQFIASDYSLLYRMAENWNLSSDVVLCQYPSQ